MSHSTDLGSTTNLPIKIEVAGYRFRRQVGSDSIGIWLDAEQESLGRKVTIKLLKPEYEHHAGAQQEFAAEMDRLAHLDHTNLTRVLDSHREPPAYLVIERVGPRSLASELAAGKPLGEKPSLLYARSIARALRYLNEQGLAHRNVTPRLVSLRSDVCRLVTLRFVVALEELAKLKGKLAQDPHYVAPEQLAGPAEIGPAAHSYQLAALLFHMLAGMPPFGGGIPAEIAKAHVREEFPSLKRLQPFLNRHIYDLIGECTQRDPDARPSLEQVEETLDALAAGRTPGSGGDTPGIVAPRPRRRRRRR